MLEFSSTRISFNYIFFMDLFKKTIVNDPLIHLNQSVHYRVGSVRILHKQNTDFYLNQTNQI